MRTPLRKVTLALAMLPLLAGAAFAAGGHGAAHAGVGAAGPRAEQTAFADGLLSDLGVRRAPAQTGVQMAQAMDPRVGQVQEQMRQLQGKIEDLNFQILQLQDQLRKTQEDNEFRFQQLEKNKRSDAGGKGDHPVASAAPAGGEASQDASAAPRGRGGQAGGQMAAPQPNDTQSADMQPAEPAAPAGTGADSMAIGSAAGDPSRGAPPQALGSIRFDANGNVIGETMSAAPRPVEQAPMAGAGQAPGQGQVASLPTGDNPNSLYQASYQFLMSGDYKAAETGFRQHVKRYPADPMTAEARYWLGESLYAQGRYPEAATVFIDTQRDYPDSRRGAENMFKLGMTLEKLDNRDVACATFAQIPQRYPKAAAAVLKRVAEERSRVKC